MQVFKAEGRCICFLLLTLVSKVSNSGVDLVRFFVLIEGASVMKLLALLLFSGW